jgi:hypothetical protein
MLMLQSVISLIGVQVALVLAATGGIQKLLQIGNPDLPSHESFSFMGNAFAWKFVTCVSVWAVLWLLVPGRIFEGPATTLGHVPTYKVTFRI